MHVGFDRTNLANAAAKLVELAKERPTNPNRVIDGKLKQFDLSTHEGARDFLMSAADDVYAKSGNAAVAQMRQVVYYSIGVVFELAQGEMHPPPLTRGTSAPAHLAYFWQVL
jgi:hypothetical protein